MAVQASAKTDFWPSVFLCKLKSAYILNWFYLNIFHFRLSSQWERDSEFYVICSRASNIIKPLFTIIRLTTSRGQYGLDPFPVSQCSPLSKVGLGMDGKTSVAVLVQMWKGEIKIMKCNMFCSCEFWPQNSEFCQLLSFIGLLSKLMIC